MGGKDGFSVNEIFSPLPEGQDAGVVGGMSLLERKKKKRPSSSSLSLIKLSEGRNADDYVFTWACSSSWTVRVAVFHGADQKEEKDEQKRRLTCLALHKKKKKTRLLLSAGHPKAKATVAPSTSHGADRFSRRSPLQLFHSTFHYDRPLPSTRRLSCRIHSR